jgi:biopolymer transport protein ExbD
MIDVVFLLIIFFLVSSHLARQENMLALDLPTANSGLEDVSQTSTVVVNVLEDGSWQLAGQTVDEARLQQQFLKRALNTDEPLRLKIRTDKQVPYRRLEPILRVASSAGIGDIVFSVFDAKRKR